MSGPAEITDCEPLHAATHTPPAIVPTRTHSRASANHATPEPVRSLRRVPPERRTRIIYTTVGMGKLCPVILIDVHF